MLSLYSNMLSLYSNIIFLYHSMLSIVSKYVGRSRRRLEGSTFICCFPKLGEGTTPFPGQLRPHTPTCWYSFIDLGRMKG